MQNHFELIIVMLAIMTLVMRSDWPEFALAWLGGEPEQPKRDDEPEWASLLMFKKGGGSAPSPDPAIGQAALKEAQLGEEWLKFSQEQFAVANERQKEQDKLANEVTKNQLDASKQAQGWATEDRQRYQDTYVPLENDFIDQAKNWDSAARQDKLAGEAKADVLINASQQRGATQRQMAGMGVSPTSGRYAGVDRAQETATALSAAGAQNTARNTVRNQAVDMKANAINMGKGMAVNPATSLGLGVNSGSAAYGTTAANNQQSAGNSAIVGQGIQGAMNGYNSQAGILNQQYQGQLSAWQAQQQAAGANSSGLMSGIGSMAGMAMVAF